MAGITETGFDRPLQADIAAEIAADQRGTISSKLDTSPSTVIGNLNNIFADRLALAYEVLEEAYNALDPDNALDDRLVALSLLSGTVRRSARAGSVEVVCNLSASKAFAAGDLVVHAEDEPENRWSNRDAVASTTAGNYTLTFVSEILGSDAVAPAGSLTVIAEPIEGFNSATNPDDASPGQDEESIEELRIRRELELARAGSGTVDAITADVAQVDGVIQVLVEENTTDATVGSLTPHSIRVVVWDGDPGLADDDDLAQAILDTAPAGIARVGATSGTAVRADGTAVTVPFSRATVVDVYVSVEIVSGVGVSSADVKAALQAAMPTRVGGDVIYHKLSAAVFAVDGVDDFVTLTIGTSPGPSGTSNIAISSTEIAQLDASNIVVTGDAS